MGLRAFVQVFSCGILWHGQDQALALNTEPGSQSPRTKEAAQCWECGAEISTDVKVPAKPWCVIMPYGGFPKLGVPFLGIPIIRTIVFWGLYWGPLILGNYHISQGIMYIGSCRLLVPFSINRMYFAALVLVFSISQRKIPRDL